MVEKGEEMGKVEIGRSGVEVVCGGTAVRVKGRGGIMRREEVEKGVEMGMVKFGRSGGNVWIDRRARKVERWGSRKGEMGMGKSGKGGSWR
jgi:deoxyribose-phosphate aldolase